MHRKQSSGYLNTFYTQATLTFVISISFTLYTLGTELRKIFMWNVNQFKIWMAENFLRKRKERGSKTGCRK